MIAYLTGELLDKADGSVIVLAGGVGYETFLPAGSTVFLKPLGETVSLYTVQIVKEDDISLYGFDDRSEVALFKALITISGVGAKAAMAILSAIPAGEVIRAIMFEDAIALTRANGIGKKTAERIVLELKDKVSAIGAEEMLPGYSSAQAEQSGTTTDREILELLMILGYNRSEASQAISQITAPYETVEEGVRLALGIIGS